MELVRLFTEDVLPVFLVAGAGWLLAAALRADARPLAQVALHVLTPSLVLDVVLASRVGLLDLLRMMGFAAACLFAPAALAFAVARWRRWPRPLTSGVILAVMLTNAGNYGLSVNQLAFGPRALAQASLFFMTSAIVSYTAGVFVASLGRASVRRSLLGLLRVPTVWAVALGFGLLGAGRGLPGPLATGVHLLAGACVPVFLLVLGMQLHGARLAGPVRPLLFAAALRLGGGALAGMLLAPAFGLAGEARQAGVLQSAMPSAVIGTILASEYDVEPAFVTSAVLLTTLLSPLTLTPLLARLR